MPYKLTDEENYLLDALDNSGFSKDAQALEAALKLIPDVNGRKYLMSRVLNSRDDLAKFRDNTIFPDVNKDFWNVSNQENYTPPDVSKAKEEGFYDEESPYHWTKRTPSELKQIAENYGYEPINDSNNKVVEQTPFHAFMQDVRDEQTKRNREDLFKGAGGTALELLYPRMSDAVKRGDDIDVGDAFGDATEQFLYTLNPIGKGLADEWKASKLGSKVSEKWAPFLIENAANPVALELLDGMMYHGYKDIPRAQTKLSDMLFGTLTNAGMGGLASKVVTDRIKNKTFKKIVDDAKDFATNKAGDYFSENPRTAKYIIRRGTAGTPFALLANPFVDWYFDSDVEKARRGELDKMLEDEYKKRKTEDLLGSQR